MIDHWREATHWIYRQFVVSVKLTSQDLSSLCVDFKRAGRGFIRLFLLEIRSFPRILLGAKVYAKIR